MQEQKPLLPVINSPRDLKTLSYGGLKRLAAEIRELIISTVSQNGGHLASNLGVVELTIALHRVYDSPADKIIWDVGHQCYAHKLLTGRYAYFQSLRKSGGIAGFPKVSESPHDTFNTGHSSTSISAALGMLAAEKLRGKATRAAAVIGDGALSGGLAYEALSHAGQLALPLVVILNDNNMSIGPSVGALSKYLSRLSMKARYQMFRRAFDGMVQKIPFAGEILFKIIVRLKRAVKAIFYIDNFFVDLGFEYVGPIDGHNIPQLVQVIKDARNLRKPVVIHVITQKGRGYSFAEEDPGSYHGVPAFCIDQNLIGQNLIGQNLMGRDLTGQDLKAGSPAKTFTAVFANALLEAAGADERIVAITAAMEEGTGLSPFRRAFPERFFDVGIAEEHAVTFAAGLAAMGLRPIAAIYSTFIQRGVDQIIHDVCLQNLPVVFALDRCGLIGDDGETHQGVFDISLFRSAPNMTILAPAGEEELVQMLRWAFSRPGPVMIRYPKAICPASCPSGEPAFSLPVEEGRGVWIRHTEARICIVFTGSLYAQVREAEEILEGEEISADLYNLRFLKPVDEAYLAAILDHYEFVIVAEEGRAAGGFGEYLSELVLRLNCSCKLSVLAVREEFDALGTRGELLRRNGLDGSGISEAVCRAAGITAGKALGKEGGRGFA